ncbi:MAG: rhodanese-like domain-containing protein [Anaerolineales bacterium]
MNPNNVPEISAQELAQKMKAGEKFAIVDVREPWEIELACIKDERVAVAPMSKVSQDGKNAFPEALRDPQAEIVVMCHHGVRSAQVTAWMQQHGWQNVVSLRGGIGEYAEEIDPSVGVY